MNISDIQTKLNNVPYINYGGCGIATLILYRWLKKENRLTGNEEFIYLYESSYLSSYKTNQLVLDGKHDTPSSAAHVCLLYNNSYIDSKGKVDVNRYAKMHNVKDENFLIKSINNLYVWNDYFDRKKLKPLIKELELNFSDVLI